MDEKEKGEGSVSRIETGSGSSEEVDPNALKRKFGIISMIGLAANLMATWEAVGAVLGAALVTGGPVGLLWGFLLVWIGVIATSCSLSELASMYPRAGGQYHFVAILAPKRLRKVFSYFAGFVTVFGWVSLTATPAFLGGVILQGVIVFQYPEYAAQRWHGTLLYWAWLFLGSIVNIFLVDALPLIQTVSLCFHLSLWVGTVVAFLVLAPGYQSSSFVFTTFVNESGWSNAGVAWSIGLLSSVSALIGYDGTMHLSEEMHNPARNVPKAMIGGILINGALGFGFILTVLFCIQDLESALLTPTGFPIIPITEQILQSKAGTVAFLSCVLVIVEMAQVPCMAAASRMMWAFARDDGLPFSRILSRLHGRQRVPVATVCVTTVLLALLGLLNIGSTTAWNAILSLAVVALYFSYVLPVALMLWRRIATPELIDYGPFRLGKFGLPCNVFCIIYTTYTSIFLLFPAYQPVTAMTFNYSSAVLVAILIFGVVWYTIRGRKNFKGLGANEHDDHLIENARRAGKA